MDCKLVHKKGSNQALREHPAPTATSDAILILIDAALISLGHIFTVLVERVVRALVGLHVRGLGLELLNDVPGERGLLGRLAELGRRVLGLLHLLGDLGLDGVQVHRQRCGARAADGRHASAGEGGDGGWGGASGDDKGGGDEGHFEEGGS